MMNRTLITLLLSLGLAIPAFAQQTTSNSTTQPTASANQSAPAPQPLTASGDEPLQPPSHQDFWDGDEPSLTWLVLHPFASKQYVRRHVQPIQDRVNELDEITADSSRRIKDVDTRAQQGIQMVSAKTSLADQHAQDASNKAQMAQQTLASLSTRVTTDETVVGNIDQYKSGAQTEIRFRPGQTVLSKQAKDALDDLAAQVKGQHGYIIEVQGFSSGRHRQLQEDGRFGGALSGVEPRRARLSHLRGWDGQRFTGKTRRRHAHRSQPTEKRVRAGCQVITIKNRVAPAEG
jgi:flagellar motor protein MotB